ncbi:MAG: hypothetical protein NVV82_22500 [Sporocytophaga sp.]|nr:hypothetical protein [Sporocytophaga sp.]
MIRLKPTTNSPAGVCIGRNLSTYPATVYSKGWPTFVTLAIDVKGFINTVKKHNDNAYSFITDYRDYFG